MIHENVHSIWLYTLKSHTYFIIHKVGHTKYKYTKHFPKTKQKLEGTAL